MKQVTGETFGIDPSMPFDQSSPFSNLFLYLRTSRNINLTTKQVEKKYGDLYFLGKKYKHMCKIYLNKFVF